MSNLHATFKWEDEDEETGEMVGPLFVWDEDKDEMHWQSEDEWMRESEARKLAEEKGWGYNVDGPTPEEWANRNKE
jgi:hypothetical protein